MTRSQFLCLAASVALVIVAAFSFTGAWAKAQSVAQAASASDVEEQEKQEAEARAQAEIVQASEEATGISQSKIAEDAKVIERVAKLLFDWSDGDAYRANREELKEMLGLAEDSELLSKVMPPLPKYKISDGSLSDSVDEQGLHSTFVSVAPSVTGVGDGYQDYFSIVTFSTSDANGAEASGQVILSCRVGSGGEVSDVQVAELA